ncbi:MAG: transglycosylase family protein [Candidatus Nanopelagicales bacterium]|nr:transglycosylase family protein [Candidatus Nanopelagicales bacterium]MDZ4248738.1 transglycosylase family protein [Candidatus Nanopelagicales bacterium]
MRKPVLAMPLAAVLSASALTLAAAPASAAPVPAASPAVRTQAKAAKPPVKVKHIKRYHLGRTALRRIAISKKWARTPKARSVVRCESGGRYKINTGNGYYGAWQFAAGTWNGIGGRRYARYASNAPKFAQNHMAWKLWKRSGWGPWGCA